MIQKSANNVFKFISVFAIAFIFSNRDIGLSPDDQNYLNYFYGDAICLSESLWFFITNEPIWCFYTKFTSYYIDPEVSLRFTLFFTTFFLLGALVFIAKECGPFWTIGIFLLFFSSFALLQTILIQIRLGFALSVFMIFLLINRRNFLNASISSLIHTVFIPIAIVFGLLATQKSLKIKKIWRFALALTFAFGVFFFFDSVDLGRRNDEYSIITNYNIFYYILILFHYTPVLIFIFLLRKKNYKLENYRDSFFEPILYLILLSLLLSYWHEGAARLYVIIDYFMICLIISLPKSIRFAPAGIFFICSVVVTFWLWFTAPNELNYVSHVLKQTLNY